MVSAHPRRERDEPDERTPPLFGSFLGDGDYEERYALTFPLGILVVLAGALAGFVAWGLVNAAFSGYPAPGQGFGAYLGFFAAVALLGTATAMFGYVAVAWIVAVTTHRVALRIGKDGVTLGHQPFPPKRRVFVPWGAISSIGLVARSNGGFAVYHFVGLRLKPGRYPKGVPRPGTIRYGMQSINTWADPDPFDVDRVIRGWWPDEIRLAAAVRRYAPWVPVRTGVRDRMIGKSRFN